MTEFCYPRFSFMHLFPLAHADFISADPRGMIEFIHGWVFMLGRVCPLVLRCCIFSPTPLNSLRGNKEVYPRFLLLLRGKSRRSAMVH